MKTPDHLKWLPKVTDFTHFNPQDIIMAYRARYPDAYRFTLGFEGGYVNDPNDPGGCTNMGITIGTLTAWRNEPTTTCEDVKNMSSAEAAMIYAQNYWAPVWGNRLPIGVNTQVWDFGVNSGPATSIRKLQELVGAEADGVMGPQTLEMTGDYADNEGIDILLHDYHQKRQAYYESLSTFDIYGNGWTRRNNECLSLSLSLAYDAPKIASHDIEQRLERLEQWAASFST